jgi:hypothetical protein
MMTQILIFYRIVCAEAERQVCHKMMTQILIFYRIVCAEAVLSGVVLEFKGEILEHCVKAPTLVRISQQHSLTGGLNYSCVV